MASRKVLNGFLTPWTGEDGRSRLMDRVIPGISPGTSYVANSVGARYFCLAAVLVVSVDSAWAALP